MIKYNQHNQPLTPSEMLDCFKRPGNRRSLAELDTVIDEILDRNPEFVEEINNIVSKFKT